MTKEYKEVIGMCTYADAIERKSIEKADADIWGLFCGHREGQVGHVFIEGR